MNEYNPAVICLSGGMDSTSLLLHLLVQQREVFGIGFDYGQKHSLELERLQANLDYLESKAFPVHWHLVDLRTLAPLLHSALTDADWVVPKGHYESDTMKQTVVPNRNAIFASIAFAYALSIANQRQHPVNLCLGVHSGDHAIYPDCKPQFYKSLIAAFHEGNWDGETVVPYLPYIDFNKAQILREAQSSARVLGLEFEKLFRNTLTSYAPDAHGKSSGLTGSDVERILAFDELGIVDPIDYARPWQEVVMEAKRIENEFRSNRADVGD